MLFKKKQLLKINESSPSKKTDEKKKAPKANFLTVARSVPSELGALFSGILKVLKNAGGIFRNSRIQIRLIVVLLLISFVPLTITAYFSYSKSSEAIESKTKISTSELMKLTLKNIQFEINRHQDLYMEILTNDIIQKFLAQDAEKEIELSYEFINRKDKTLPYVRGLGSDEKTPAFANVSSILNNKFVAANNVNGTIFVTKKGYIVNSSYLGISSSNISVVNKLKKLADKANGSLFWALIQNTDGNYYLTAGKKVRSLLPEFEGKDVGYFFLVLMPTVLSDIIRDIDIGEGANVYVLTSTGQNLANTNEAEMPKGSFFKDKNMLKRISNHQKEMRKLREENCKEVLAFSTTLNSEKTLVAYSYYPELDWYVVATIPYSYLQSESRTVGMFIFLIAVICLVAALILSTIIAMSVSVPLKKMVAAMKEAKDGNLTINIQDRGRDEIGEVIENLNEMVANIKQLISKVSASAKKVLSNSDEIKILSERSYASSEQIALTMQEIAKGASEQAAEVAQGVNYMNNLSEGINRVGNEMSNVSKVVTNTRKLSQDALVAVKYLNDKAVETNDVSEKIVNDIIELGNDMKEIKKIVKMIVGIADQTNLLSLNAAIEAARAGEAGRGFAVVADEVKKLADQSKLASININDIINKIQQKTEFIVNTAGNAREIVKQQMTAVVKADNAFNTILAAMEDISKQMEAMDEAVREMITSKENALTSIDNISAVSQESAATAEEVSASTQEQMAGAEELSNLAKELRQMAQELSDAISTFRVE